MSKVRTTLLCLFTAAGFSRAADRPNVLLICIDDLRPELRSFGVDYIQSPAIDRLAAAGRPFFNHYVQAPTCGASRYALLTGRYGPGDNEALFRRAAKMATGKNSVPPSLPEHFRTKGYTTVSVGKVSHHPGGRGGADWDDDSKPEMPGAWDRHLLPAGKWQHPRGAMHGLAHGEIRQDGKPMTVFQSAEGPDTNYPDGLITDEALAQLDELAKTAAEKPFFLAVGIIRPHLPFGAPARYFEPYRNAKLPPIPHPAKPEAPNTWHGSGEFMRYENWGKDPRKDAGFADEVRKHYAACVSFADAQVGRLLESLEKHGLKDDTIIVLWGDHGWHLGEHNVWGKHTLFEESLRSPLVLAYPGLPSPGEASRSIVETVDLFPTLCDLAGIDAPSGLSGRSLRPLLEDPQAAGRPAVSYFGQARSLRTADYRLIEHRKGGKTTAVELYDHRQADGETTNIAAENPGVVDKLAGELDRRLKR
ncbi:sulfatase [Luteolibacter marinus]|uniref:sulfatase n=1 Tax=Luteolibacter marinus TaxID=2776705 RepID=UPI001866DD77|nr:sulfatase [Luteolibacter marinus]